MIEIIWRNVQKLNILDYLKFFSSGLWIISFFLFQFLVWFLIPIDLEFNNIKLYLVKKLLQQVPPRLDLGSLDSESKVLTITPRNHTHLQCISISKLPNTFFLGTLTIKRHIIQRIYASWSAHIKIYFLKPVRYVPLWRNGIARWTSNSEVVGSNPIRGKIFWNWYRF